MLLKLPRILRPSISIPHKKNLNTLASTLLKQELTHPLGPHHVILITVSIIIKGLSNKFIHQRFVCASHHTIQNMSKLDIYTGLPKTTPKIQHPYRDCLIAKFPHLSHTLQSQLSILVWALVSTWTSYSSTISLVGKFSLDITITDTNISNPFGYPTRSKLPPIYLILMLIKKLFCHD